MKSYIPNRFATPEESIYQQVESYAKIYPSLTKIIKYAKPIKVRKKGFEARKPKPKTKSRTNNPMYFIESTRRTKTRLSDIVLSNDFDLFCTFTFDPKKTDRYDIELCKKRMGSWLANQGYRVGQFKYLVVPELHQDGALHFHALFQGYKGELSCFRPF